jgi:hypothetical protein
MTQMASKYPTMPGASRDNESNPTVRSKGDLQGIPRKPGEVSKPGGVAPFGTAHSSGKSVTDGRKLTEVPVRHIPYSNPGQQVKAGTIVHDTGRMLGGQNPTAVSGRDKDRSVPQRDPVQSYPKGTSTKVPVPGGTPKVTRGGPSPLDKPSYGGGKYQGDK